MIVPKLLHQCGSRVVIRLRTLSLACNGASLSPSLSLKTLFFIDADLARLWHYYVYGALLSLVYMEHK